MLEHLRVLDLTDERGLLCGRMLADLGADVVQVEPLGGSTARSAPPVAGPSLYWETFAAGKRGLAVDLDDEAGVALVRELAARVDVVVTSLPAPWLRERGLDPDTLRAASPQLVYTHISAFGWTGPKAAYADSDLVVWAAGGPLDPHRGEDGRPLRISVPQAFLHASADAAAGSLLAVLARGVIGGGQVVDVSAQASVGVATLARNLASVVGDAHPEWHQQPVAGRTDQSGSGAATPIRLKKWQCRDGMVELHLSMGPAAGGFTNALFGWLRDEGAVGEPIASWDWRVVPERLVSGELTAADIDEARAAVRAFLLTKTKAEVLDAALERRLLCMAIFDTGDIAASEHLQERGFWATVDIDGTATRIPGRMAQVSGDGQPTVRHRAPRVGEHTADVLRDWLGRETPVPDAESVGAAR
jgi:crotonobetainyl-CoA:carnitine CoA-transferase CaiB-like acyl-CoA transferase